LVNLLVAFVTGLTTGGLSCLAVQGGLLAASLSGQIEADVQKMNLRPRRRRRDVRRASPNRSQLAAPILAFLAAKIVAYTLLGFLLGLVGQMFQLSPATRAFLQIAIGIFMLGSALRMLNVHPVFRIFAVEPPAFIRRKLRKTASERSPSSLSAPLLLGFMTVLIPCGVTQAMMAAALGTGDPAQAAALMAAFTLGTSPVFFAVSYFAVQLGKKLERNFTRGIAAVILILAILTIDSGITLAGSPLSLSRWVSSVFGSTSALAAPTDLSGTEANNGDGSVITINVKNTGYEPAVVHARADAPVTLRMVSKNVRSCSLAVIIPALDVFKILEPTGVSEIEIPAQAPGTRMPYSCSMGMYSGTIIFDG
jgi:sulfite exporter TauE/SafE